MSSQSDWACPYCRRIMDMGRTYWHLYGCDARARAVLAHTVAPLMMEGERGLLCVRTDR